MPRMRTSPIPQNVAALITQLGGISPQRIRLQPPPGMATDKDLLRLHESEGVICELVDGTLVEKVMGAPESALACDIIEILNVFVKKHQLGFLLGEAGTTRILPKLVRAPDIAFISWNRVPNRQRPTKPVPDLVPDLAIEVLSKGNTRGEMKRKRKEYFLAGVALVWQVDPRQRTVQVFTAPDQAVTLTEQDTLEGGNVLPGFKLPVREVFAEVPQMQPEEKKGKKRRQGE